MKAIILSNLMITGFLTGLIWFVQIVHYPIFAKVGAQHFINFHNTHTLTTGQVVALPMVIELVLAIVLATYLQNWEGWLAGILVGIVWALTFFYFVPLHGKLGTGFNAEMIASLVAVNWARTIAWTARLGITGWIAWKYL